MESGCLCHHHNESWKEKSFEKANKKGADKSSEMGADKCSEKQAILHVIKLLQSKFISPYKIMYMLDQKQADYFKSRNSNGGCCSSSSITIKEQDLTKVQRCVLQCIGKYFLVQKMPAFLEYCQDRYQNIVASSQQQHFKVTKDVQKYLIDQILSESVNNFIFKEVQQQLSIEIQNYTTGVASWATPQTWVSQYGQTRQLNSLTSKFLSNLHQNSYSYQNKYFSQKQAINQELALLEKDGKFEEVIFKHQNITNITKSLTNLSRFISKSNNHSEDQRQKMNLFQFPQLKEIYLKFISFPFEINYKSNQYCTVNESVCIQYYKNPLFNKINKVANIQSRNNQQKYEVLVNFGGKITIKIKKEIGQEVTEEMEEGSLFFIECSKVKEVQISSRKGNYFLIRSHIFCVERKK